MPEYLAPGVYVEERSFRSKSIEGVSTSTTGFVGATRYGPTEGEPELITSFTQFERIYGGLDPLNHEGVEVINYLAHAVRGFFDNGGARLYIARAYTESDGDAGVAGATIPTPNALISSADALAVSATNATLTALGAAVTELNKAKATAMIIFGFATNQVMAALTATPPLAVVYDYGTGDTVLVQINNWITPMAAGAEKTALEAARTAVQALLTSAQTAYSTALTRLTAAAAAQTSVTGAYDAGVTAGGLAALPPDPGAAAAAASGALQPALDTVVDEAADLPPLSTTLDTSLTAMTDNATAATVVTNINNLSTAANQVITAANTERPLIFNAARDATAAQRATVASADALWTARYPGEMGNMTITVTGRVQPNVPITSARVARGKLRNGDLVLVDPGGGGATPIYNVEYAGNSLNFRRADGSTLAFAGLNSATNRVYPLRLNVEIETSGKFDQPKVWTDLTISALPDRLRDSITQVFAAIITNRLQEMETPVILDYDPATMSAAALAERLTGIADWRDDPTTVTLSSSTRFVLTGGSDGARPEPSAYEGAGDDTSPVRSGLKSLEDLEDISIIAAPGYSYDPSGADAADVQTINQSLITHCEIMRYRVAVLDSPNNQSLSGVREYAAMLETTRAALYYPWVRVMDPVTTRAIDVPPSGFMAGIYARNDNQRGVHKAPANEVVRGAIGLETLVNKGQQDVLNPLGINCIRYFEGRGINVWGARTVSADPEWKYLNIRRYFVYLEASIDRSTQWAVFEPNGESLWQNVRRAVEDFLYTEWKEDRLAGAKPEDAFFVRCDQSTMTQNDIDNGRMICLIGVSPLYPAEFVIFRIGQWTADRK